MTSIPCPSPPHLCTFTGRRESADRRAAIQADLDRALRLKRCSTPSRNWWAPTRSMRRSTQTGGATAGQRSSTAAARQRSYLVGTASGQITDRKLMYAWIYGDLVHATTPRSPVIKDLSIDDRYHAAAPGIARICHLVITTHLMIVSLIDRGNSRSIRKCSPKRWWLLRQAWTVKQRSTWLPRARTENHRRCPATRHRISTPPSGNQFTRHSSTQG